MTPTEELKAAAARIREVASAATPGPWISDDQGDKIVRNPDVTALEYTGDPCGEGPELEYVVDEPLYANPSNGPHIAMWHPLVAQAVADLLEATAKAVDGVRIPGPYLDDSLRHELAIARAILGGVR